MSYLGIMAGAKGCDFYSGANTITPPKDKKIVAFGVSAAANITNYKYTPPRYGDAMATQKTVTDKTYLGVALAANPVEAFIPLDHPADVLTVASGDVWVFYG